MQPAILIRRFLLLKGESGKTTVLLDRIFLGEIFFIGNERALHGKDTGDDARLCQARQNYRNHHRDCDTIINVRRINIG